MKYPKKNLNSENWRLKSRGGCRMTQMRWVKTSILGRSIITTWSWTKARKPWLSPVGCILEKLRLHFLWMAYSSFWLVKTPKLWHFVITTLFMWYLCSILMELFMEIIGQTFWDTTWTGAGQILRLICIHWCGQLKSWQTLSDKREKSTYFVICMVTSNLMAALCTAAQTTRDCKQNLKTKKKMRNCESYPTNYRR